VEDKALPSLLAWRGGWTGPPGPFSSPARTKAASLQSENPRESGCLLATSEKTARSVGTGKSEFGVWLFGKHLPGQKSEPRVCKGRGGQL